MNNVSLTPYFLSSVPSSTTTAELRQFIAHPPAWAASIDFGKDSSVGCLKDKRSGEITAIFLYRKASHLFEIFDSEKRLGAFHLVGDPAKKLQEKQVKAAFRELRNELLTENNRAPYISIDAADGDGTLLVELIQLPEPYHQVIYTPRELFSLLYKEMQASENFPPSLSTIIALYKIQEGRGLGSLAQSHEISVRDKENFIQLLLAKSSAARQEASPEIQTFIQLLISDFINYIPLPATLESAIAKSNIDLIRLILLKKHLIQHIPPHLFPRILEIAVAIGDRNILKNLLKSENFSRFFLEKLNIKDRDIPPAVQKFFFFLVCLFIDSIPNAVLFPALGAGFVQGDFTAMKTLLMEANFIQVLLREFEATDLEILPAAQKLVQFLASDFINYIPSHLLPWEKYVGPESTTKSYLDFFTRKALGKDAPFHIQKFIHFLTSSFIRPMHISEDKALKAAIATGDFEVIKPLLERYGKKALVNLKNTADLFLHMERFYPGQCFKSPIAKVQALYSFRGLTDRFTDFQFIYFRLIQSKRDESLLNIQGENLLKDLVDSLFENPLFRHFFILGTRLPIPRRLLDFICKEDREKGYGFTVGMETHILEKAFNSRDLSDIFYLKLETLINFYGPVPLNFKRKIEPQNFGYESTAAYEALREPIKLQFEVVRKGNERSCSFRVITDDPESVRKLPLYANLREPCPVEFLLLAGALRQKEYFRYRGLESASKPLSLSPPAAAPLLPATFAGTEPSSSLPMPAPEERTRFALPPPPSDKYETPFDREEKQLVVEDPQSRSAKKEEFFDWVVSALEERELQSHENTVKLALQFFKDFKRPPRLEFSNDHQIRDDSANHFFNQIFTQHKGICLGEDHKQANIENFLLKNMEYFQRLGVNTIFYETPMSNKGKRRNFHNLSNTDYKGKKDFSGLQEYSSSYLEDKVLLKAEKLGIQVLLIDHGLYCTAPDRSSKPRLAAMNYYAYRVMSEYFKRFPAAVPLVWVGRRHLETVDGIPGLGRLFNIPSVFITSHSAGIKKIVTGEIHWKSMPSSYRADIQEEVDFVYMRGSAESALDEDLL